MHREEALTLARTSSQQYSVNKVNGKNAPVRIQRPPFLSVYIDIRDIQMHLNLMSHIV